jgi:hypothetical protein
MYEKSGGSSLAFDFPGNSYSYIVRLFIYGLENKMKCNDPAWCDFVKPLTALRMVELFVVNLNSLSTLFDGDWELNDQLNKQKQHLAHFITKQYIPF